MGDLPTPDSLASGRYAKPESYSRAKNIINSSLAKLYAQKKICGGAIYGSTINGETRLGSDIDVFVIANSVNTCMPELQALRTEVEKRSYIPIEINPLISIRQAEQGTHIVDGSFLAYLKIAIKDESSIGSNPVKMLKKSSVELPPPLDFIIEKEGELRRLTRDCSAEPFSDNYCKFLSRMLNYTLFLPKDIYFALHNHLYEHRNLSKPEMVETYKKEFPKINSEVLDETLFFWRSIKNILNNEKINVNDYKDLLIDFSRQYDAVEEFILTNIALARNALEKSTEKKHNRKRAQYKLNKI